MLTRRQFVKGVAGVAVVGAGAEAGNREKLVAPCGLYCGACPMYLATQEKDETRMKSILQQFSSGQRKFAMEDLLCDGCIAGGRVAAFCLKCGIRDCAAKKTDGKRCAGCSDFACSRITGFNNDGMVHHSEVLSNLRQLQKMGIRQWAKYEEERWRCPQCGNAMSWYDAECSKCRAKRSDRLFALKKA